MSFNLASTSGKKTRDSHPKGIDNTSNACYTNTMTTNRLYQQLRNPDDKLWREVKAAAVMEEKTMTQWVEEACKKQLALTKRSKMEEPSSKKKE